MSVVLHAGMFKTGTTSIQRFLRDHPALLARHGYRFPHGWLRRDNHLEPHLVVMRLDRLSTPRWRNSEWRDPAWRADVAAQLREDLARHPNATTILSGEHNSYLVHDDELAALRDLLGADTRVVMAMRDPQGWLASYADQLTKWDVPLNDDPASWACATLQSWQVNYAWKAAQWRRHFDFEIICYDDAVAADGSIIPAFCRTLGIEVPDDAARYWENRRGAIEPDVPGNRFTNGLRFGEVPPRPTHAAPAPS